MMNAQIMSYFQDIQKAISELDPRNIPNESSFLECLEKAWGCKRIVNYDPFRSLEYFDKKAKFLDRIGPSLQSIKDSIQEVAIDLREKGIGDETINSLANDATLLCCEIREAVSFGDVFDGLECLYKEVDGLFLTLREPNGK